LQYGVYSYGEEVDVGLRVAIAGASGYAGGELLRLLAGHPELDVVTAQADSRAGEPLVAVHPQLVGLPELTLTAADPTALAEADVVFLALPHGASAQVAPALGADQLVIDLGADFRLVDRPAFERYYGLPHPGCWTYGLPELPGARARIAAGRRIANPGCYPTAAALALAPLLAADLVAGEDVVVVAASGTSGAGRKPLLGLLGAEVMGDVSAYKIGGVHQHTPEIAQSLTAAAGRPVTVSFTPLLVPMPRGILATCTARLRPGVAAGQLRAALESAYAHEPFVHLLPEGVLPHTAATFGGNSVHLQVAADEVAGRAVVVAAIDNLVKGAAGQAIQNANIALGLPETTALSALGVAP